MKSSVTAWVAICISLVALCFSYLQWREAHYKLLLELKPSINFMTNSDDDDPPVGISIENAGPGPAIVRSLTYFLDKKPFGDCDKVTENNRLDDIQCLDLEEGDTLGVGRKEWLIYFTKTRHLKDRKELDAFENMLDNRLAVQMEFCPVMGGACTKKCSVKDWCE